MIEFNKPCLTGNEQKYECPICGFISDSPYVVFPYSAKINEAYFKYLRCNKCSAVYVNPPLNNKTIALMYKDSEYHRHYNNPSRAEKYKKSVGLLASYLSYGSKVLDYGCGDGYFLKLLSCSGFYSTGVEYNTDAIKYATNNNFAIYYQLILFNLNRIKSTLMLFIWAMSWNMCLGLLVL